MNAGSGPPSRRGRPGPGPSISRARCLRPGAALMRNKLRHILSVISSSVSKIYGTIMARAPSPPHGGLGAGEAVPAGRGKSQGRGAGTRGVVSHPRGRPAESPPRRDRSARPSKCPAPGSYRESSRIFASPCIKKPSFFYPQGINKMSSTQLESVPMPTSARGGKAGPASPAAPAVLAALGGEK